MMLFRRLTVAAGAALVTTGLVGLGPVAAADDPSPLLAVGELTVSKHADGPYQPSVTANLAEGSKRTFFLKAKHFTGGEDTFVLNEDFNTADYKTKYYRNDDNITTEVEGVGYEFNLGEGKAKKFRLKVKRLEGAPPTGCVGDDLHLDGGGLVDGALVQLNSVDACA